MPSCGISFSWFSYVVITTP
uniref:Uncharacterized protein n=1 Tax=Arundo donax TaxID=35708 RepID=A0A0A8ZJW3_ARUDO